MPDGEARVVAGRYRLLRELGRGGMGVVWLAEDEVLDRRVAVKELRPPRGLAGADLEDHQRRALREARSAARIHHPNAVTLHEIIAATAGDDAVYLIMELIEGSTLAALIARHGPLPAPRVARYGLQMLDVLEAARELGIVHRDVKPGNILISAADQVKLADFGIAHAAGDSRLTHSGIMGTYAYMAPELFEAHPKIAPAVDLWALGATLYHAAEGHGAFDRENTGAVMAAVLVDDLPVPRCSPALAAAITGMLQRDPARRATIEQARRSLKRVAAGQPRRRDHPDANDEESLQGGDGTSEANDDTHRKPRGQDASPAAKTFSDMPNAVVTTVLLLGVFFIVLPAFGWLVITPYRLVDIPFLVLIALIASAIGRWRSVTFDADGIVIKRAVTDRQTGKAQTRIAWDQIVKMQLISIESRRRGSLWAWVKGTHGAPVTRKLICRVNTPSFPADAIQNAIALYRPGVKVDRVDLLPKSL